VLTIIDWRNGIMNGSGLEHQGQSRLPSPARKPAAGIAIRAGLVALAAQIGLHDPAAAQTDASGPPLMDRQREIALALSACPLALASEAAVYVLEKTGYTKVRDSANGFTAIIQHSTPPQNEPQCMDAEGSRTILQRYLKVAEWRSQGKTEGEIRQLTANAVVRGELKLPSRPGVDYMLSSINTVRNNEGEVVAFPPHVMFFGTNLTNADLGVGKNLGPDGQPIGPVFVAADGTPYSLVIVPVGVHAGMPHSMADMVPPATSR
jgi:hypothetical protein